MNFNLIEYAAGGYRLSAQGQKLQTTLKPLTTWAQGWSQGA
jgi:DNA-binding HxlR family transcriptional regulator